MDFVKRHIPQLASVAAVLVVLVALAVVLGGSAQAVPDNPASSYSQAASVVAWTGEGYKAPAESKQQDDTSRSKDAVTAELVANPDTLDEKSKVASTTEYRYVKGDDSSGAGKGKTSEKKREDVGGSGEADDPEEQEDQAAELEFDDGDANPESRRESADDDTTDETVQVPEEDPEPDPNEGKYPQVKTDLVEGESIGRDWRTFTVRATDWEGRYLDARRVRVNVQQDGEEARLYAKVDDGYEIKYRLPVDARDILVTISATDRKGRRTTVERTVHRAETDDELVVDGSIRFVLEAKTVGLGRLVGPVDVEFYEGEQLPHVLERALQEQGYGMRYAGSLDSGFYLRRITRTGITDGWEIPERLLALLESVGYTEGDWDEDSLGQYDFSGLSGWMYFINDVPMSTGMSSYYPADGDEIRLSFSLYSGSDIGANTSGSGPDWEGKW